MGRGPVREREAGSRLSVDQSPLSWPFRRQHWGRRMIDAHQSEPAIGPLQDVLDYLGDAIRLNGRVVERLSDYQLAGGRSFVFHQHELENLPGVVHNTFDPDGPVWLAVEP